MNSLKLAMTVVLAATLAACGGPTKQETGAVQLSISGPGGGAGALSQALMKAAVTGTPDARSLIKSVHVSFESPELGYFGDFERVQLIEGGMFPISKTRTGLFAGSYTVTAYAYDGVDGGTVLYTASATVVVSDRQITSVSLVMQQVVAPGSVVVTAPFIRAIVATGVPAAINKPVHLVATVTPSPSPTYLWTATCPSSPFGGMLLSNAAALATDLTFFACEGDANVTFSVTDANIVGAGGSITSTVQFVIPYVPQGIDIAGISINSWPNIASISPTSNAQPLPGEPVALVAHASDPEDQFTSTWSDNCGGSFVNGSTLTPTWTAPNTPNGECVLTLMVQEAGNASAAHNVGHNSATFTLHVGAVTQPVFSTIAAVFPPAVPSQAFQAQQTAEFGDSIALGGTGRHAVSATVMMVTWAQTAYPSFPITLNLYDVNGNSLARVMQDFALPAVPAGDPTCPLRNDGTGIHKWRSSVGCSNGFAFPITFDLNGITLPDSFGYGIAYNTQTYGSAPIGTDGPWNSLNVGLVGDGSTAASTVPAVGSDPNPNALLRSWVTGGHAPGFVTEAWTGYAPAVEFSAY